MLQLGGERFRLRTPIQEKRAEVRVAALVKQATHTKQAPILIALTSLSLPNSEAGLSARARHRPGPLASAR